MTRLTFTACLGILISFAPGLADSKQPAVLKPVPIAKTYVVPAAQLLRVDEGVFELQAGKAMDLTDRKILLAVVQNRRGEVDVTLNNSRYSFVTGKRIDLKRDRKTSEAVSDRRICFLDLVDLARPQGTKAIATFRLHCI